MIGLLKAIGIVKTALAVTVLTAATAFAAQVGLPAAATFGQSHSAPPATVPSEAPESQPSDAPNPAAGKDVTAIQDRLAANRDRLLQHLGDVLAKLEAKPNPNPHAVAALQAVIDRIQNGDTGLNRASDAVGGAGGGQAVTPSLPAPALDHPTPSDHPAKP